MTVRSVPIFLQAGSHPAEETRLMLGGLLGAATGSFSGGVAASDPAHGVVRSTDLAVSQNGTPNMTVNVAAGGCFIRGTLSANQGAYHLWNDGTINVGISTSNPTNPRRDLICAVVKDSYYSGSEDSASIVVVTGTAAASPVDPTPPANALVLARVAVAANASSITTANITDLRPLASVRDQVPAFASSTDRATAIPSPYTGQLSAITAAGVTNGIEQYNGTAWRLPWSMPWGEVGVSKITSNSTQSTTRGDTGLTITTGTLPSNRYLKHTVSGMVLFGSVNDMARFSIFNAATGGSSIFQADYMTFSGSTSNAYSFSFSFYETTASTAAISRRITQERIVGTSSWVQLFCDSNRPATYIIEDIGPSGAPA